MIKFRVRDGKRIVGYEWIKDNRWWHCYKEYDPSFPANLFQSVMPDPETPYIREQWSTMTDSKFVDIYDGDRLAITTENGIPLIVVCKFGLHRRKMDTGVVVDIPSFAFVREDMPSFPIVENYMGVHDLEIIKVIKEESDV